MIHPQLSVPCITLLDMLQLSNKVLNPTSASNWLTNVKFTKIGPNLGVCSRQKALISHENFTYGKPTEKAKVLKQNFYFKLSNAYISIKTSVMSIIRLSTSYCNLFLHSKLALIIVILCKN